MPSCRHTTVNSQTIFLVMIPTYRQLSFFKKFMPRFKIRGRTHVTTDSQTPPVIDDPLHGIFNVANQNQKWTDMAKGLSAEQLKIVAFCLTAMNDPSGQTKFVFVNAPAGYGKTHLARAIASCLRGHGHSICCTATTALASVLHEGGRTAHSAYGIPVSDDSHLECDDTASKFWGSKHGHAHLWDEAPSWDENTSRQ